MTASLSRSWTLVGAAIVFAALTSWTIVHAIRVADLFHGATTNQFAGIYAASFFLLMFQMVLCYLERPWQSSKPEHHHLVVIIPAYNEDPDLLKGCLTSLFNQSRRPDEIHVVDDGSKVDYSEVRFWFLVEALQAGITPNWVRTVNQGKRHAQGEVVRATPSASIYLTVDSDADLDREAIREGLKPFANRKVQAVGGVVLASNCKRSFLTRFTDLWFVTWQLVDRSAFSTMRSVLVNSGVLAFYRAPVLRDNLHGYLNETFFGRPVKFSDDSMLTMYALRRGLTVQQPSSFAFTAMPERVDHHLRQQVRWMRGSFIRSWWRMKYLPLGRYAFWAHLLRWMHFAGATTVFLLLFIIRPAQGHFSIYLLLAPILIGYGTNLRYLAVRRSDQSRWYQFTTFLLTPVTALWAFFVLRPTRWYSIATCFRTGWGTRQEVEVVA